MANMIRFLLPAALLLAAAPAFAETQEQKQAEAMQDAQENAKRAQQAKEDAAKAPPPAIPGAVPSGDVAPASKNAAEMSPNDALFDAITRGDAGAARDAMNRGAQLDAHNVLGETPIDASIEANRTDITFMLLSLRAGATPAGPHPAPVLKASATPHGARGRHAHSATFTQTAAARPNPGTPNPAVGFNGF